MILILDQLSEYYIEKLFMETFPYLLDVVHCTLFIWTKGPQEPWNEAGSQSLAKHLIRVWT